jgi:hypothetical protein
MDEICNIELLVVDEICNIELLVVEIRIAHFHSIFVARVATLK